jgi:glutamate/tyrosine decarboxylase-like PLP-dependent enzyme
VTSPPLPEAREEHPPPPRHRRPAPRDGGAARPLLLRKSSRTAVWRKTVRAIEAYLERVSHHAVGADFDPQTVRELVAGFDFASPIDALEALDRAVEGLWRHQTHTSHPRCFGLFVPAATTLGIASDALVAAFNPQLANWAHSPFAVEVERHLVRTFGAAFGYAPERADGTLTSGGAEANHTAIVAALAHSFPDFPERGLRALSGEPVLYMSAEGHGSIAKAARFCGLGSQCVRAIRVDAEWRADPADLAERIAADRRAGSLPFLVVGTAGTTGAGAIDPLDRLADVAESEGLWLHADAGWGGAAAFVPELRHVLAGVARADSIAFDAHKWLSAPMGAGFYLTRHSEPLERACEVTAAYMPRDAEAPDVEDPYRRSLPWSRRFAGLKVLLALAVAGWDGYAAVLRNQVALGGALRHELERAGWGIVSSTPLPLVCFVDRWRPDGRSAEYLDAVARHVVSSGKAWLSTTRLGSHTPALRACISNYRTTEDDVRLLIACLAEARREVPHP